MKRNNYLKVGDIVDLTQVGAPNDSVYGEVVSLSSKEIILESKNMSSTVDLKGLPDSFFPIPVQRCGKWGYVNKEGVVVLPFRYDFANFFENGKAQVTLMGEDSLINVKGLWVDEENDPADGEMSIYVLQSEGKSSLDEHESIIGIFRDFSSASAFLNQYKSLVTSESFFGEEEPVLYDQPDCYRDRTHYYTIRKRSVLKCSKGSLIYSVIKICKSNVIVSPYSAVFFSTEREMHDYIKDEIARTTIDGLTDLNDIDPKTESLEFVVGVHNLE